MKKKITDYSKKELIKLCDKLFSEIVRRREADALTGYVTCSTCGKQYHWKEMDCSHYISRRYLQTRWTFENCIAQCRHENRFQEGNKPAIRQELVRRFGSDCIEQLEQKTKTPWAEDVFTLRGKADAFKLILKGYK